MRTGSDAEVEGALTAMWLELAADEASGPPSESSRLPNPLVYRHGRVVLRRALPNRVRELAALCARVGGAAARRRTG